MPDFIDRDLPSLVAAAIPFVEKRRKPTGGFGATPGLPATIEDTFYALDILALAQGKPDAPGADPNLRAYLAGLRRPWQTSLRTMFQLVRARRLAGLDVAEDQDRILKAVKARLAASTALDDRYYGTRLAEALGLDARELPGPARPPLPLSKPWHTADEAWMLLFLAQAARQSDRLAIAPATWFQACQNGDGGFGFLPGTTSFIENSWYCLQALALLGAQPLDLTSARRFLACCQTASGGFSRNGRAAPFLDATWHGLTALAVLENMAPDKAPARDISAG